MKKSLQICITWVLVILLISSCENSLLDRTNKNQVEFGELANMRLQYPDTVLMGEYNRGKNYLIDLDQDGQADYNISSLIWGSPGMGMIPTSGISSLHEDAKFLGYFQNDTTFRNFSRREFQGNNIIEVYETYTFSCFRMDSADSIFKIDRDVFKLDNFSRGDRFSQDDTFESDSLTLVTYWTRSYRDMEYIGEDTVLYAQRQYNNDCFTFPQNEIRYIGVKLDGKNPKLGWVKLSISEYFRVFILECAIQK